MLQASGGAIWDYSNSEASLGRTVSPRQPLILLVIERLRQEDLCHVQIGLVFVVNCSKYEKSQSCRHTHTSDKQLATDSSPLRWGCEEGAAVTIICSVPGSGLQLHLWPRAEPRSTRN